VLKVKDVNGLVRKREGAERGAGETRRIEPESSTMRTLLKVKDTHKGLINLVGPPENDFVPYGQSDMLEHIEQGLSKLDDPTTLMVSLCVSKVE
jgi:hypothetical protein